MLPGTAPFLGEDFNDDYDHDLFVHRDTETQCYFDYDYDDDFFCPSFFVFTSLWSVTLRLCRRGG